jgi:putative exporter of polyketide antibiotics
MTAPEVWFEKWMWSYVPIHWKGWLVVLVMVATALSLIGLTYGILTLAGHRDLGFVGFAVVPVMIFGTDSFLNRHSRKV